MRKVLGALVIVFAMTICASAVTTTPAFKAGDRVFAQWSGDSLWYAAVVLRVEGNDYQIIYGDRTRSTVTAAQLAPFKVTVGQVVDCSWQCGGAYYTGKITEASGDMIHIVYDDGGEEDTLWEYVRVKRP